VQSDTTIRLWRGQRSGLRLQVQTGAAQVVAAQSALELQTDLGMAILQVGSELRVSPGRRGARYDVTLGRALLTTRDGQHQNIAEGETIGGEVAPEPAVAVGGTTDGGVVVSPPPPQPLEAAGDLELAAGASAIIYDPVPPSRVQFAKPERCSEGAQISLREAGGPRTASLAEPLALAPGSYNYQVACTNAAGEAAAAEWRGQLNVVRNAGTAQLPRTAPNNAIDADGRTYTVLFQNLLPVLAVRWPNAPAATSYSLSIKPETGAEQRLTVQKPRYVFAAGALPEGRHQLQFETSSAHSRVTTIDLRFDNAAPMASLKAPAVSGFEPGSSVHVAGLALPGSQVSVLGQKLALDGQQRFAGDVPLPAGTSSFAVRIHHPRTGTRYYVRRMRPAP
jgi:hypothetical protein